MGNKMIKIDKEYFMFLESRIKYLNEVVADLNNQIFSNLDNMNKGNVILQEPS